MPELTLPAVIIGIAIVIVGLGMASMFSRFYRKVGPDEAVIRSGKGGLVAATGEGIWIIPVLHRADLMDISVKRIEIHRRGVAGLICKDNVRADIEVAFFVRVDPHKEGILEVAQTLGPQRASEKGALVELFDAKFSEALKTVGKHFNFVELYTEREQFKNEILKHIGTDLNGYKLDDCAIDYLEQTPLEMLNPNNILDAEGIKKISDLTARELILANHITREKEKTIKKQDVEAAEAIMELERQRVEAEEKQKREIAVISARERAEAEKTAQEQRLRSESARIATDEEVAVAEQNMQRQVVVARKNKERTEAIETERVEKDRMLEVTERERVVGLAHIEKEKVIEAEKRNIQDVIRERVIVERAVVEQKEKIKDTEEFAAAERAKQVTVTRAEMAAQEAMVREVKAAEASKQSAQLLADQVVVEAEARRASAEKETQAKKMLAEAHTAEAAAQGLAEAQVMEAKAAALQKQGEAEADVMQRKYGAEADGIHQKAAAMKELDGVGKEHEEFKLRLSKDKEIEIAAIAARRDIAEDQSRIVGEALKSARIDIVGGETTFFDSIVNSIQSGKSFDRWLDNSNHLRDVKETFFQTNGDGHADPDYFRGQLRRFVSQFNLDVHQIRDLSIAALIGQMLMQSSNDDTKSELRRILDMVKGAGLADKRVSTLDLAAAEAK